MNNLVSAFKKESNKTLTENGALTYKSTKNKVLDFFALGGALRSRPEDQIINLFDQAYMQDRLTTLKMMFYFRDIRGGQGERRLFKVLLKHMANEYRNDLIPNLNLISEYGRWDDILVLLDTKLRSSILNLIEVQLHKDNIEERPSLLAKWLPSENATSKTTKVLAASIRTGLNLSSKSYRKILSKLRAKIKLVESQMCSNEWGTIEFGKVPSKAALKYRKAFDKHEHERYQEYLEAVKAGKDKINASVLYPYDIIREVSQGNYTASLDAQWQALPDYFNGKFNNGLVMADVSGSMSGLPLDVSISLAMYIAERNKGAFHNMFMTFSSQPEIQEIKGKTINQKYSNLSRAAWEMNTNLAAAFDKILELAKKSHAKQDEMPDTLYIVSDMEFDRCVSGETNFKSAKSKFKDAGYKLPDVVFWNVNSRNDQVPVTKNKSGVFLVSGCSPSILKYALNKEIRTAEQLMMETLNSERYSKIVIDN